MTVNSQSGDGARTLRQAYDHTVDHIGDDVAAGAVWMEYAAFLKGSPKELWPAGPAGSDATQRMAALRTLYQRALWVPMGETEALWKEYERFEIGVDKALAKKLLADIQQRVGVAKMVYKERAAVMNKMSLTAHALPPERGAKAQRLQLDTWWAALAHEKCNMQRMEPGAAAARVALCYEQCLMCHFLTPQVWVDFATWHVDAGRADDAAAVYKRAMKALPHCLLLHFAYADLVEVDGLVAEAQSVYDALVQQYKDAEAKAMADGLLLTTGDDQTNDAMEVRSPSGGIRHPLGCEAARR